MNFFLWSKGVERAVKDVRAHAESPENWYRPGLTPPPGESPLYQVHAGTVRVVFSWTVMPPSSNPQHPPAGSLLRHMTVSVHGEGRYPRPEVIWTLAHHFGFTGATPDESGLCRQIAPGWVLDKDETDKCIILQEIVEGVMDVPPPSAA